MAAAVRVQRTCKQPNGCAPTATSTSDPPNTCRISGQITHADNDRTENLLIDSVQRLVDHAGAIEAQPPVRLPEPHAPELEQAMLPRKAFFEEAEHIPADKAVGRIAAEILSPYPPGIPVVAPGEVITREVVAYLRSGMAAGMLIPDAAGPTVETLRVFPLSAVINKGPDRTRRPAARPVLHPDDAAAAHGGWCAEHLSSGHAHRDPG
ncbi:Orn/Lys/Arg family decarboxylase [Streptomyces avermitilis]|uniref:Orn/Lys/Arg family decarboxylase n=1 Tax=Streptomyces avermitilis TaxID=33903 RepID=UPI00368DA101